MSASSTLIADTKTVIAAGPAAASKVLANAAAGPIMDYPGNMNLVLTKLQEADVLLKAVKTDTDSTDSANLTLINTVLAALEGTATPSTTLITDLGTVITNGANAASLAKAIAAAGPMMDYQANLRLVRRKLQEAAVLLAAIKTDTDSGDSSLTGINSLITALS